MAQTAEAAQQSDEKFVEYLHKAECPPQKSDVGAQWQRCQSGKREKFSAFFLSLIL